MIETLDTAAMRAREDPDAVLSEFSWLGEAIDRDVIAGRFDAWARSSVIDENVGVAVLAPAVFHALHRRAGLDERWPVGNAGLLHVYGYLLSDVPTPYGLKRDRWLDGALARAFGEADDYFVPWASPETLLTRVTAAASALRERHIVRSACVDGVVAKLALGRDGDGAWALVYDIGGRLVTTFPVTSAPSILDEWDAQPQRLRWNAEV